MTTKSRDTDDIHGDFVRPMIDLNHTLRTCQFLIDRRSGRWILVNLSSNTARQLRGLRPENRVQFLDVSETESGSEMLALKLVLVALDDDQSIAENHTQEIPDLFWFLKIITLVDEDFCKGSWVCQEQPVHVEEARDMNESFVGDFLHEFKVYLAGWSFEHCSSMSKDWKSSLESFR